jgi:hypothetical protein
VYGLAKMYLWTYIPVDIGLGILAWRAVNVARGSVLPTSPTQMLVAMEAEEG